MARSHSSDYVYLQPTAEEREGIAKAVFAGHYDTIYWRKGKRTVRYICSHCQQYHTATLSEWKQIKNARICPHCFKEIKRFTEKMPESMSECAYVDGAGYYCCISTKWNRKPKITEMDLIYWDDGSTKWVRHCCLNMGWSIIYNPNVRTHKTKSWNYINCFYNEKYIRFMMEDHTKTKRQYLEEEAAFITKSNQKRLVIDNLFSPMQMCYIVAFDLKRYEDVMRYRGYMKANPLSNLSLKYGKWVPDIDTHFNLDTLKYLAKNKIKLSDYKDYDRMCKELGRKTDKPKDFKLWHDRVTAMIDIKKNEKMQKNIAKMWKVYKGYTYEKNSIVIKAFESYEEIYHVAHSLNNCMARLYAKPYSEGATQLYHLDVDGKPTIAIEINKGKLMQARSHDNGDCPAKYKRIINNWARKNELIGA